MLSYGLEPRMIEKSSRNEEEFQVEEYIGSYFYHVMLIKLGY